MGLCSSTIETVETPTENPVSYQPYQPLSLTKAISNRFSDRVLNELLNTQGVDVNEESSDKFAIIRTHPDDIVRVTPERLDIFEGCQSHQSTDPDPTINTYRREQLEVTDCQQGETPVQAWTYIRNKTQWVTTGSHGGKPSPQYLTLIKENIEQHWREPGGVSITIRRADTLEIVEEWSGKHLAPLNNPIDGNFGPTTQRALQQFLLSQELCNGQKKHILRH